MECADFLRICQIKNNRRVQFLVTFHPTYQISSKDEKQMKRKDNFCIMNLKQEPERSEAKAIIISSIIYISCYLAEEQSL